jgi:hypothetical protein
MSSLETIAGWPTQLPSRSAVPEPFHSALRALPLDDDPSTVLLLSPEFRSQGYHERSKLLCVAADRIACLERLPRGVRTTTLERDEVHTVECGSILLHAWIRFEASGGDGGDAIEVAFNSVCRELYWAIARSCRAELYAGWAVPVERERAKFDVWRLSDYAFMNLAKRGVIEGARVEATFLQRRITGPRRWPLRHRSTPGWVGIGTQREAIFAHEGDGREEAAYGGRWTTVRKDMIRSVRLERPAQSPLGELRIVFPGNHVHRLVYEATRELALREYVRGVWPSREVVDRLGAPSGR